MTEKNDLLDNNTDSELNNENDENTTEKLTKGLYNTICSVIFNTLSNSVVRNIIKTNSNILKLLELQISNLFFLESELRQDLENKKYSRNFLQIISDITDLELSISKSPTKTRTEILEDSNLLVVTIFNSVKGIERESLERLRTINDDSFKELTNQISALDDFNTISNSSQEETVPNNNVAGLNSLNQGNNQPFNGNNNLNNPNMNANFNPNANFNNLTNLGLLPQHPAANPNFYPYLSKPSAVPKLRKLLVGALSLSILFILITVITSFFVKGSLTIDTKKGAEDFSLSQLNNWIVIVITLFIFAWSIYVFLKPMKVKREMYHTSLFVLIVLAIWIAFTVGYFFWGITDGFLEQLLKQRVGKDGSFNPDAVAELKKLQNFQIFDIFSIITGSVSILPILILVILILINPRLDRNKVMRANAEYQNAIAAAMSGQKYDIDPTLFDKEDDNNPKLKKSHFSGRF